MEIPYEFLDFKKPHIAKDGSDFLEQTNKKEIK